MVMDPIHHSAATMQVLNNLPLDILPSILSHLVDRRDRYSCALVNKTFNRVTTPLLYRKLDSRILSNVSLNESLCTLPPVYSLRRNVLDNVVSSLRNPLNSARPRAICATCDRNWCCSSNASCSLPQHYGRHPSSTFTLCKHLLFDLGRR